METFIKIDCQWPALIAARELSWLVAGVRRFKRRCAEPTREMFAFLVEEVSHSLFEWTKSVLVRKNNSSRLWHGTGKKRGIEVMAIS